MAIFVRALFLAALLLSSVLLSGCGVNKAQPAAAQFVGGVVPHHDLASDRIKQFWEFAKDHTSPDLIVLVSPDHRDAGRGGISGLTDASVLQTKVPVADELVITLAQKGALKIDNEVFRAEHGIQLELPFIATAFPQTPVAALVVKSNVTLAGVEQLAGALRAALRDQKVLVVASVDFSHYRSFPEAEHYDQETLVALQTYDWSKLFSFGPEHIDSEQAVTLVARLVCPANDCPWQVIDHANSVVYGAAANSTTSYFLLWLQKN